MLGKKKKIPCIGEVFEHHALKGHFILGTEELPSGRCSGKIVLDIIGKTKQETIDATLDAIIKHGNHKAFVKILDKHTKVC